MSFLLSNFPGGRRKSQDEAEPDVSEVSVDDVTSGSRAAEVTEGDGPTPYEQAVEASSVRSKLADILAPYDPPKAGKPPSNWDPLLDPIEDFSEFDSPQPVPAPRTVVSPVPQKESPMLNLDIALLEKTVDDTKALLKDGLKATDIFDVETGLSLAGYNTQPEAVALFTLLTKEIQTTLSGSGFPMLSRYYMLDLQDNNIVVLQLHGDDLCSGMLLDATKVNLGILVSVAMPRYAAAVIAARGEG